MLENLVINWIQKMKIIKLWDFHSKVQILVII